MKHAIFALALSGLASCTAVGPDFQSPEVALATRFAQTPASASLAAPAHDRWWHALQDPALDRMVDHGLRQNLSIQSAVERVRESRAQLSGVGLESLASGDLSATATQTEVNGVDTKRQAAGLTVGFILDIFGGQRRQAEQAEAQLAAAIADVGAARLAYQVSVVETYLTARYYQAAVRLREGSIANRRRLVQVVRQKLDAGEETNVSLRRTEAELTLEQASLPELKAGLEATAYALATLLAAPGDQVLNELAQTYRGQPVPKSAPTAGVPADLLRNRPDVKAAEYRLAAAVAAVGVSEAQLYPSLRLDGLVSTGTSDTLQFGPTLDIPIFTRTALKANRAAAESRARQAELSWKQTVLTAVEEVQVNLARTRGWARQAASLTRGVSKYREAARLSREVFDLEALTLIELIDTEDQLSQASLQLANARLSYAVTWARLNVATGHGAAVGGPIAPDQGIPVATAMVRK